MISKLFSEVGFFGKILPMDIYKISVTFLFVRMTIQAVMKEYDI